MRARNRISRCLTAASAASALAMTVLTGCSGSSGSENDLGTAKEGTLKVGTIADGKPYDFVEDGKQTGFDMELLEAMAEKMDVKVEYATQDFSALLSSVNTRQFDMAAAAIGITDDREKLVDFSDGYLAGYYTVLTRKDGKITGTASAKGKKLAVMQGSIQDLHADELLPGAVVTRFPDINSASLAVQNGRVDGYFTDYDVATDIIKKKGDGLVTGVLVPGTGYPAGFAVHKGNDELADALDKALKQVVDDGTWLKLYKKYFPGSPVPTRTDLPPYTAGSDNDAGASK